jgi:hypothetical protein
VRRAVFRVTRFGLLTAVACVLVTACSTAPAPSRPPGTSAAAFATGADWPTYHRDNARTGFAPDVPPVGTLAVAWHARLDGAVYGQPLVVGDLVLAATENDTVYGIDAHTGSVRWSRHVGTPVPLADLPCGNIDPLGITGTMVYDPASRRVYAVAETTGGAHTLYGVDATTGAVAVSVPVEPPLGDRIAHQQRAALTLLDGRIYVAFGGLFGDCGNYVGSVVSVTTAGTDRLDYHVPTTREGGIWAPGGAVVADDRLLYSVGNGESTTAYDGSDAVLALDPTLHRTDFFAPTNWAADNAADADLGSAGPTLLGDRVFIAGKRATGYVLRRNGFGGIGGQLGSAPVCRSFGGSAVAGSVAYLPCTDGQAAITVAGDAPKVAWHVTVGSGGSPVVGGGAVWVVDTGIGVLAALAQADGHVLGEVTIGPVPHFASPSLSGGRAYVGTTDGVVAVAGV